MQSQGIFFQGPLFKFLSADFIIFQISRYAAETARVFRVKVGLKFTFSTHFLWFFLILLWWGCWIFFLPWSDLSVLERILKAKFLPKNSHVVVFQPVFFEILLGGWQINAFFSDLVQELNLNQNQEHMSMQEMLKAHAQKHLAPEPAPVDSFSTLLESTAECGFLSWFNHYKSIQNYH